MSEIIFKFISYALIFLILFIITWRLKYKLHISPLGQVYELKNVPLIAIFLMVIGATSVLFIIDGVLSYMNISGDAIYFTQMLVGVCFLWLFSHLFERYSR